MAASGRQQAKPHFPFVSSEVETPVEIVPGQADISTSLDANGLVSYMSATGR